MTPRYTAVVQQSGNWWIGCVEEVPGVNSQGATREECSKSCTTHSRSALEMNRTDPRAAAQSAYEEVRLPA